ncbi:hypothetical protein PESHB4_11770 [Pediococcus ethanolidurans]
MYPDTKGNTQVSVYGTIIIGKISNHKACKYMAAAILFLSITNTQRIFNSADKSTKKTVHKSKNNHDLIEKR